MASWRKGSCIALCITCKQPILHQLSIIQSPFGNVPPDPMTYILKHYRKWHPEIFDAKYRR